eukprot:gene3986-biopygen2473
MDMAETVQHRANNPSNKNLNKDTIKKLQDELLAVNPYAQEYKHVGEVLQKQQEELTAANWPIPTSDMNIMSRANQDRRYDSPAASEIAAIYSSKDGGAPYPNDRIMPIQRREGYLIDMRATNPYQCVAVVRPKGLNFDLDRVRPPDNENKSLNGQKCMVN